MKSAALSIAMLLLVAGLCLASGPDPTAAGGKKKHAVAIEGMKFSPDKLEIKVGDTVEWTNNDDHDHTVKAKDGSFESDNLSHGETFRYTFKKAGTFPYNCSLHPRMKGSVVVSPN
jgi:plastocyanin